jgi:hypothetical protein
VCVLIIDGNEIVIPKHSNAHAHLEESRRYEFELLFSDDSLAWFLGCHCDDLIFRGKRVSHFCKMFDKNGRKRDARCHQFPKRLKGYIWVKLSNADWFTHTYEVHGIRESELFTFFMYSILRDCMRQ